MRTLVWGSYYIRYIEPYARPSYGPAIHHVVECNSYNLHVQLDVVTKSQGPSSAAGIAIRALSLSLSPAVSSYLLSRAPRPSKKIQQTDPPILNSGTPTLRLKIARKPYIIYGL